MPKHILLFIYNSFNDPIVQGSVLTYINRYKHLGGKAVFTLITFEQNAYKLTKTEVKSKKEEILNLDIKWVPFTYHTGGSLILFKKIYDLLNAFFYILRINKTNRIELVYTVGSIAGSMGYFIKKMLSTELLVHTFEPHSEFMVDFDIWSGRSVSYKLLHKMENTLSKKADYIMTGTEAMISRIKLTRKNNGVYKVPSCVDLEKFKPDNESRARIRKELNIENKLVLLYLGKFGGIYFEDEPFDYFNYFLNSFENETPHVLIISQNPKSWVEDKLSAKGITKDYTILNNIPFAQIQDYINAGDIGYCGIPPLPSQKFRSPIKNGEYLACGLPYIVYKGVSEDDIVAIENKVGVVLKDNSEDEIQKSLNTMRELFLEERHLLTKRCNAVAKEYRGIQLSDEYYKHIFG